MRWMVIIGAEGHSDIFNNKYLFHNIFWVYTDAQNSRLVLTVRDSRLTDRLLVNVF